MKFDVPKGYRSRNLEDLRNVRSGVVTKRDSMVSDYLADLYRKILEKAREPELYTDDWWQWAKETDQQNFGLEGTVDELAPLLEQYRQGLRDDRWWERNQTP